MNVLTESVPTRRPLALISHSPAGRETDRIVPNVALPRTSSGASWCAAMTVGPLAASVGNAAPKEIDATANDSNNPNRMTARTTTHLNGDTTLGPTYATPTGSVLASPRL